MKKENLYGDWSAKDAILSDWRFICYWYLQSLFLEHMAISIFRATLFIQDSNNGGDNSSENSSK